MPASSAPSLKPGPTRATVLATIATEPLLATWMPTANRADCNAVATSKTSLSSTATRSAVPFSSIAIPEPTVVSTFCLTMNVRTEVRRAMPVPTRSCTRLPVTRTCPGWTVSVPGSTTMPSAPGSAAEGVDGVRVHGRVGADHDAGSPRRDPVASDLQRAAGGDGAGGPDAGLLRGEDVVPRHPAVEEVGGRAAEVDAAVEREHDVVLDPQSGPVEADRVASADANARARNEDVAPQVQEQPDAGELDGRAARVAGREREDRRLHDVRQRNALQPDRGRGGGAADDGQVLDGHSHRLRDPERRAARDEDRREPLATDAERPRVVDLDAVADVVHAGRDADRAAAGVLDRFDGILDGEGARRVRLGRDADRAVAAFPALCRERRPEPAAARRAARA